jgi:hypothetical protein
MRQYLKIYPVPRPAASYCLHALGRVLAALAARQSSPKGPARLSLTAAGKKLRVTLRFPARRSRSSHLKARLPQAPPGVEISLTQNGRSALFSLTAPLERH